MAVLLSLYVVMDPIYLYGERSPPHQHVRYNGVYSFYFHRIIKHVSWMVAPTLMEAIIAQGRYD
jgi:hypothetical protein